jgi:hypothetical protein
MQSTIPIPALIEKARALAADPLANPKDLRATRLELYDLLSPAGKILCDARKAWDTREIGDT